MNKFIKLSQKEIDEKIKKHRLWLNGAEGGERLNGAYDFSSADLHCADLRFADLTSANLHSANLRFADLTSAILRFADLSSAKLYFADLCSADLSFASLCSADLRSADLRFADLRFANLKLADLNSVDLRYADLYSANLHSADLYSAAKIPPLPIACPSHGAFIAWKKVSDRIVKLLIPEDAKRCSATSNKCRADKAMVVAIENIDGSDSGLSEILNQNYAGLLYKVGEMVYPDSFDDDRWNECSHGIHFFIDRGEAERW